MKLIDGLIVAAFFATLTGSQVHFAIWTTLIIIRLGVWFSDGLEPKEKI